MPEKQRDIQFEQAQNTLNNYEKESTAKLLADSDDKSEFGIEIWG